MAGTGRERLDPTQDVDVIWADYIKRHEKGQDLLGLVKDPKTKPEFWKKAIDTFLVNGNSTVIVKDEEYSDGDEGDGTKEISWVQELSRQQVLYVTEELPDYIRSQRGNTREYNSIILDSLPILSDFPEQYSTTLFKSFDSFAGLKDLLRRGSNYDTWKREAVRVIHGEIEQEKAKDSSKKDKLISYEGVLGSLFGSDSRGIWLPPREEGEDSYRSGDRDKFLAKEIAYVIDIDPTADRPIVDTFWEDLNKIFDELGGSARLAFVERQVLGLGSRFRVRGESSIQFAQKVIQEFPKEVVAKRLRRQLAAQKGLEKRYERERVKQEQSEIRREAAEKAEEQILMNAMREP